MKKRNKSLLWFLLLVCGALARPAFAQDDVYYDPDKDAPASYNFDDDRRSDNDDAARADNGNGDDEYYDDEDYAYEYSSRIRRFHRSSVEIVDYYDPFYVDLWQYDPYYLPGASIYTYGYNDYWTWRRWHRWQRYNAWNNPYASYGCGYNSWGWYGSSWGGGWGSPWNSPFVVNNYYYDPYWTWNGYNPYYSDGWAYNNYYYNNGGNHAGGGGNGYNPKTYTGPRRGGTTVNPGYVRINDNGGRNGRLIAEPQKPAPSIELGRKNGRGIVSDREPVSNGPGTTNRPNAQPGRTNPGTTEGRAPQTDRRQPTPDRNEPATTRPGTSNPSGRPVEAEPGRRAPQTEPQREPTRAPRTDERRERPNGESTRQRDEPQNNRRTYEQRNEEPRPSRRTYDEPRRTEQRTEQRTERRVEQPRQTESPRSYDSGNRGGGSSRSEGSSGHSSSTPSSSGGGKRGRD